MNMNIFELIEDKAQAKRVADIMSGTTPFPNRGAVWLHWRSKRSSRTA